MDINRKTFIESLGGPEAVNRMDAEQKADALEEHMLSQLNDAVNSKRAAGDETQEAKQYPTVAEVEAQIETRKYRECVGFLVRSAHRRKCEKAAADARRIRRFSIFSSCASWIRPTTFCKARTWR